MVFWGSEILPSRRHEGHPAARLGTPQRAQQLVETRKGAPSIGDP